LTPVLQLQGRVFCAVSLALVVALLVGVRPSPEHELLAVGVLILLLGVPHGSLDVVVARRLFGMASVWTWVVFLLLYLGLAALVVALWWIAPELFLWSFLGFSALHFGGDMAVGVTRLERLLYGGGVIVLPALWHGTELQHLLGLVAGNASAASVAPALHLLALPWLCATGVACALRASTWPRAALEWAALAALSLTAPPLVAFTVYFCAMHSPRHILKTLAGLQGAEARHALAMALWPTVAVLAAAVVAMAVGALDGGIPLETRLMQFIFVGLAALTLPHMALLERARQISLRSQTWS